MTTEIRNSSSDRQTYGGNASRECFNICYIIMTNFNDIIAHHPSKSKQYLHSGICFSAAYVFNLSLSPMCTSTVFLSFRVASSLIALKYSLHLALNTLASITAWTLFAVSRSTGETI